MSEPILARDRVATFEAFRLDRRGLSRARGNGGWEFVALGSRALGVLRVLVDQSGELVTKQALMDAVWPGTAVEDSNLTVQISALRRALDHDRSGRSCILTVVGRGYRFLPTVKSGVNGVFSANAMLEVAARVPETRSRLSVVVLPFRNLGEDTTGDRLAATITDDIITDLPQCVSVVVRNLSGIDETGLTDPRQVGLNSGVSYVIQGSVRGTADQTSVNIQLIDVETGSHLWAERFTTDHGGIAEVRDEITRRPVGGLVRELIDEFTRRMEATVPPNDWSSNDLFLHGCAAIARPLSIENRHAAISSFERALQRDPGSVEARIEIAGVLIANLLDSWSTSIEADTARAEQLLLEVLRGNTSISRARTFMGMLRRYQGRLSDSQLELELAIEMSPRSALATGQLGLTLTYLGEPETAVPWLRKSLRLAPHDPPTPVNLAGLGLCHLMLGDLEAAINDLRKARVANPLLFYVHFFLAAAFGLRDEPEEASAALRQGIELMPEVDSVAAMLARWPLRTNSRFAELFEKSVIGGLRRAGLPDA